MALSADRKLDLIVDERAPSWSYPVETGYKVYRNSIVAICQDGALVPAGTTGMPSPIVKPLGLAHHYQDNTGAAGVLPDVAGPGNVPIRKGTAALPFDTAPTYTNIGAAVYAIDDQTVSLSSSSGARLQIGTLDGFDVGTGTPYVFIS